MWQNYMKLRKLSMSALCRMSSQEHIKLHATEKHKRL